MSAPGIIIAAPASGSGKTTITLALLRALRRQGRAVGAFKVGPDYIDPMFHARASGRPSVNLDSWAMRIETLAGLGDRVADGVDLVLGEGVMGLFDGAADGQGSSADLAALFDLPSAGGRRARHGRLGRSPGRGLHPHRDDVEIAGVLLNRVASAGHEALLRRACDDRFAQPVLACLPRDPRLELPARHLGLVPAAEVQELEGWLDRAAGIVGERTDLDRLVRLARPFGLGLYGPPPRPLRPLGQRIAVASDIAFAFAYPATIDGWRVAGAEILPFAPLADQAPDPTRMRSTCRAAIPSCTPAASPPTGNSWRACAPRPRAAPSIYGECGGYMALGRTLTDRVGQRHAMAGLLPVATSFAAPRLQLGYRRLKLLEASPLARPAPPIEATNFTTRARSRRAPRHPCSRSATRAAGRSVSSAPA